MAQTSQQPEGAVRKSFGIFLGLMTAACLAVLIFYLTLPADPKNAVMWGFSYFRLGLAGVSLALTLVSAGLLGVILAKSRLSERARGRLQSWAEGETGFGFISYHLLWLISSVYMYLRWFHFEWIATDMQVRVRPFLILWILLNAQLLVVWVVLARAARPRQKLTAFKKFLFVAGKSRQIFWALLAFTATLYLLSIAGQMFRFFTPYQDMLHFAIHEFHLDDERNLPTYFSMGLMIASGLLMAVTGVYSIVQRKGYSAYWLLMTPIFLFLAYDDYKEIHEQLGVAIRERFTLTGFLNFAWYIPVMPVLLVLFLFYVRFLWHLPKETRNRFLAGAVIFVMGAVGLEAIGSKIINEGASFFVFVMLANIEETVELVGLTLFVAALLDYLAKYCPPGAGAVKAPALPDA